MEWLHNGSPTSTLTLWVLELSMMTIMSFLPISYLIFYTLFFYCWSGWTILCFIDIPHVISCVMYISIYICTEHLLYCNEVHDAPLRIPYIKISLASMKNKAQGYSKRLPLKECHCCTHLDVVPVAHAGIRFKSSLLPDNAQGYLISLIDTGTPLNASFAVFIL